MDNTNNKFHFFVPLDISKGKNESGEEIMKIGGIASTTNEDSDEEVLEPGGFDLKPFLSKGFINWNHQSKNSPSAIIGEPTKAEVKKNKLYIEGELYQDSSVAKDVYSLAKTLSKSKGNRALGFSIEGKVLERDPFNQKHIKKAMITGVAITPTPKNKHTLAQIIKGEVDLDEEFEYDIVSKEDGVEKGSPVEYILDVEDEHGNRITVTKDLQIKMKKSLTTAKDSGGALALEDVEGSPKNLQKKDKKLSKSFYENDKNYTFTNLMTKSEVFEEIFTFCSDIKKAKEIYNIIEVIDQKINSMAKDTKNISPEAIEKAQELLGILDKEDGGDNVEKGDMTANGGMTESAEGKVETGGEGDEYVYKMMKAYKAYSDMMAKGLEKSEITKAMKKAGYTDEEVEKADKLATESVEGKTETGGEGDEYVYKSYTEYMEKGLTKEEAFKIMKSEEITEDTLEKAHSKYEAKIEKGEKTETKKEEEEEEDEKKEKVEKSEIDSEIEKAEKLVADLKAKKEEDKVEKGEKDIDLSVITKAIEAGSAKNEELIKALGTISKAAIEKSEANEEQLSKISQRLGIVEEQPTGRKSVITKSYIENKEDTIEKGGEEVVFSISKNKPALLNKMEKLIDWEGDLKKGENAILANGAATYEASSVMPNELISLLTNKHKVKLIK